VFATRAMEILVLEAVVVECMHIGIRTSFILETFQWGSLSFINVITDGVFGHHIYSLGPKVIT